MMVRTTIREQRVVRSIIGFVLVVAVVLTSACSAVRLGYGQVPTLAYHWLDGWVDFDDTQGAKARDALEAMHRWHRRTQLPDYARWLEKTAAEMPRGDITADEVCRAGKDLEARWFALVDHLAPAAAELMSSLSDAQIARLEKRFDEGLKRFRDEHGKGDAKAREKASLERGVSRSETIYGSIDDAQRALLAQAAKTPLWDPEIVIVERKQRVRDLIDIAKEGRRAVQEGPRDAALAKLRLSLRDWAEQGVQSPRADYRAFQKRMQEASCALSAQVHNAGGTAVRQAAREKLASWAADAKALADNGDPR
jgi:Family of unknown function (DUF6279)